MRYCLNYSGTRFFVHWKWKLLNFLMDSVLTIFKICAELLCNFHFYLLECVILTNQMFLGSWCPGRINSCWRQRVHIKVRCLNISPLYCFKDRFIVVFCCLYTSVDFPSLFTSHRVFVPVYVLIWSSLVLTLG